VSAPRRGRPNGDVSMPNLSEEQPILAELAHLGLDVGHIQDLYQNGLDYRRAIPTLVSWIPRVGDATVKEMLVRAVTDRAARGIAGPTLIEAFEATIDQNWSGLPWVIGNAIDAVADPSLMHDMIRLARDGRYGRAREMIVMGTWPDSATGGSASLDRAPRRSRDCWACRQGTRKTSATRGSIGARAVRRRRTRVGPEGGPPGHRPY
jgi:hypothetical protein